MPCRAASICRPKPRIRMPLPTPTLRAVRVPARPRRLCGPIGWHGRRRPVHWRAALPAPPCWPSPAPSCAVPAPRPDCQQKPPPARQESGATRQRRRVWRPEACRAGGATQLLEGEGPGWSGRGDLGNGSGSGATTPSFCRDAGESTLSGAYRTNQSKPRRSASARPSRATSQSALSTARRCPPSRCTGRMFRAARFRVAMPKKSKGTRT